MAKKILPFWLYPSHWGLKGQAKELAEIDFYFEGLEAALKRAEIQYPTKYDREKAKNEIKLNFGHIDQFEFEMNKIQIDFDNAVIAKNTAELQRLETKLRFGEIAERDYDAAIVEMTKDEDKRYIAALDFALKYEEITQNEYDKELATFKREPWFLFDVDYDEANNDLIMSFDYNEYFWKKLREEGHPGNDEHEIIDNFIKDWGRKLATEDYSGDYDTKLTSVNDEMNRQSGSGDFRIYE